MNKGIIKSAIAISIAFAFSNQSLAAGLCTGGAGVKAVKNGSSYQSDCPSGKTASSLSGAAQTFVDDTVADIQSATEEMVDADIENTLSVIKAINEQTTTLTKAQLSALDTERKSNLDISKAILDQEMSFLTEQKEAEIKASRATVDFSDSKEETLFLLDELKEIGDGNESSGYNHVQMIIESMKQKYDNDPEFRMPHELKMTNNTMGEDLCEPYDPKKHKMGQLNSTCFSLKPAKPGNKLQKLWEECNRDKSNEVSRIAGMASKSTIKAVQLKREDDLAKKSMDASGTFAQADKLQDQAATSCTETDLKYGLCLDENGEELTEVDYYTKVINNEIVPHGNISSSNFLTPSSVGSTDGETGLTEDELKSIKIAGQQKRDSSGNVIVDEAISSNTAPLVQTYRSSSQYFAAQDFAANIVNRENISGLSLNEKNEAHAELQAKIKSREAKLSLAENSFNAAIQERIGVDMANALADGSLTRQGVKNDSGKTEVLKEGLSGAGEIDRLTHKINEEYGILSTNAQTAIAGGGITQFENAPESAITKKQIEALATSIELSMKELESNERMELLLSAILASELNSPSNVKAINDLKKK